MHLSSVSISRSAFIILATVLAAGCGSKLEATVFGTVTLDEKPLTTGAVTFHPTSGGAIAYGRIAQDGSYWVKTGDSRGLLAGQYTVTVVAYDILPARGQFDPPGAKTLTPLRYSTPDASDLHVTVAAGQNRIDLALKD